MAIKDGLQPRETSRTVRRWGWQLLGYAIAAGCLYWVFHNVPFAQVLRSILRIDWWWVPLAAALDLLVYACAAWEWQLLLKPAGHLSFGQTLKALLAGRFANDVLPVHAGYIIRVYLASAWTKATIAEVLPSLLIERLFDSFWLALGIGLTAFFFPLPSKLARTGEILGGFIVAGVAMITWTTFRKRKPRSTQRPARFSHSKTVLRLHSFLQRLAQGLRSIGRSNLILAALGLSIIKLIIQCLAFLALLHAYALQFSLWTQLAVFIIAYIGISMPSTPAGIGVFQLLCVAGLRFFGVPKPVASGFALLAYVVLTLPLAIAGLIAVTQSGLTLRSIRRQISQWKRP